jgi:hypothetical protein
MMNDPMLQRIQREAGIPELIDVLVERLAPTDLQSLLLEVYRRRVARVQPRQLLERYERDRFVRPSDLAPSVLADFESLVWSLLPDHYIAVELSPVCPLGTNATVAMVDQSKVITTIRNTEVMADATNVLALECASRRRLLGLCTAGRDEGAFQFEMTSLVEQITFYLQLLREVSRLGYQTDRLRVTLTDLEQGQREQTLIEQVLKPLLANHSGVLCEPDPNRETGRGYYVGACFHIYATNVAGTEFELIDGGFTTWTLQLLSNRKERLLISGLGTERLCSQFNAPPTSVD